MSGPEFLRETVAARTTLSDRYLVHASHQSMSVYLADWERALERLQRQIGRLRACRDERLLTAPEDIR